MAPRTEHKGAIDMDDLSKHDQMQETLIDRARGVAEKIASRREQTEIDRRVPMENLEEIIAADLLGVIQSKRTGGHELSMRAHLEVVAAIAEGCPATGWVLGVLQAHTWVMAHMPAQAQDDVYKAGRNTMVGAVIGPRGKAKKQADGTFVLNGVWPFGSGSERSEWLLLGAEVLDENDEVIDIADMLVPTKEVQFKDDWHVIGLKGTGSCSIVVKDLQIPAHRHVSLVGMINRDTPGMREGTAGWIHYGEAVPVLALALCGSSIGLARSAIKHFKGYVPGRPVMYTEHIQADWSATQIALATACSNADAGAMLLYRCAEDIDTLARKREAMSMELRGRTRMDCAHGVRLALDATEKLFLMSGGTGLSMRAPMQQYWRDLHAINVHGLIALEPNAEIYGRVLLGKEPGTFII